MKPIARGKYNKYIWDEQHIKFLRSNYENMTNQELADALDIKLTKCREKLYELGLQRMHLEYWTDEQVEFLRDNYTIMGDTEIAEIFQENWPKKKGWTKNHIAKKRSYLNLKRTDLQKQRIQDRNVKMGRFAMCPIKAWESRGGAAPLGTIKIWGKAGKPIAVVKTENGYVHYNRWLFEKNYFTLPSDILVVKKSGKIKASGPNDLMIIDRAEHSRRNGKNIPEELMQTIGIIREIEKELVNN
ncbi:hypothetical protein [Flagellimonas sp.]|uniref:hypothetical protein n=1 Tax=Flagellimonas sp. TaxID=2058762 RepID=UPI003BAC2963